MGPSKQRVRVGVAVALAAAIVTIDFLELWALDIGMALFVVGAISLSLLVLYDRLASSSA